MSTWITDSGPDALKQAYERATKRAKEAVHFGDHQLRQQLHRAFVPPKVSTIGERIVHDLRFDGVSITSLDELNLKSNAAFREAADGAVEELNDLAERNEMPDLEYPVGFDHCIPLNPSRVATAYPALYTWGLDEDLLNIVERFVGRPLAYHGVIIRREIVDNEQRGTRFWHLDGEDYDITRISIYLTDVLSPDDGAFEYAPRSVSPDDWKRFTPGPIDDEEMEQVVPSWQWKQACGPAGSVLFKAVSRIFHRGRIPQTPRIAASYYYTTRNPKAPELCRQFSFLPGMKSLKVKLSPRQLDCLWEYRNEYQHQHD